MNIIRFLCVLFTFTTFHACKEQSLEMFEEDERGASIYFTQPYNTGLNTVPADSVAIKFGFMPDNVESAEASISVSVAGPLHNIDREFKIQIDPNATLVLNKHYQILNEQLVIPAGKRSGQIKVKVFKTEEMKAGALSTSFELLTNESFNTKIAYRWKANMQKKVPVLKYRMMADNKFDKPYLWVTSKSLTEGYLGEYSFAKLSLILELFDEDLEHFMDPKYTDEKYFTVAKLSFWGSYMKYWLGKEASEGRVHLDENNKEIKMGPNAN